MSRGTAAIVTAAGMLFALTSAGCAAPPKAQPAEVAYQWPSDGWHPSGTLADIPLAMDCEKTRGSTSIIERTFTPPFAAVYFCADALHTIESEVQGASHFFIVREYGFYALRGDDPIRADIWAAEQLANASGGRRFAEQAIRYLLLHREESFGKAGTGRERAHRIARAAQISLPDE